jgi:hypothetical protein
MTRLRDAKTGRFVKRAKAPPIPPALVRLACKDLPPPSYAPWDYRQWRLEIVSKTYIREESPDGD